MNTGPLPPNPMGEVDPEKESNISNGAGKNLQQDETQQLTKQERRKLKKQRKQEERRSEQRKKTLRKAMNIAMAILIAGGGIFALGWFLSSRPNLPPTSQQNHSEQSPPAHIVTQPISDAIQRHMLEHADGSDRNGPGIIIQYNCSDFDCESDLTQKLTTLAEEYPDNVYLAPNTYDGKIILTKLGKREILEEYDEQIIKNFIE